MRTTPALPVLAMIRQALTFALSHFRQMLFLVAPPLALSALFSILAEDEATGLIPWLREAALTVDSMFFAVVALMAVTRLALGMTVPKYPFNIGREEWRLFCRVLLLALILIAAIVIPGFVIVLFALFVGMQPLLMQALLALVVAPLMVMFILVCWMLPPVVAAENGSLGTAWERSSGNRLRILLLGFGLVLPSLALVLVQGLMIRAGVDFSAPVLWAMSLVEQLLIVSFGGAAMAFAYRAIAADRQAEGTATPQPIPGAGPASSTSI